MYHVSYVQKLGCQGHFLATRWPALSVEHHRFTIYYTSIYAKYNTTH
jgi:hypothetical protein